MTAPSASVAAVQKALGCERGWDIARPDRECLRLGHNQSPWTDRGCPVAVAAADAAVEAATPGIQAGALREAAEEFEEFAYVDDRQFERVNKAAVRRNVASILRARADDIEPNP